MNKIFVKSKAKKETYFQVPKFMHFGAQVRAH